MEEGLLQGSPCRPPPFLVLSSAMSHQPQPSADSPSDFHFRRLQEKLEFKYPEGSKAEVEKLVYTYIEGLQWVMHYYYTGVASWGWFYNYHYAPRISGESASSFNAKNETRLN